MSTDRPVADITDVERPHRASDPNAPPGELYNLSADFDAKRAANARQENSDRRQDQILVTYFPDANTLAIGVDLQQVDDQTDAQRWNHIAQVLSSALRQAVQKRDEALAIDRASRSS